MNNDESYDAVIIGGGPAGAICAAACAAGGLRVVVVERARFPREKVCGDCLNPDCWPVLARLGAEAAVRGLPHVVLGAVEFVGRRRGGPRVRLPLPRGRAEAEVTIKRGALDASLLAHAVSLGAETRMETAVVGMRKVEVGSGKSEVENWNEGRLMIVRLGSGEELAARFVVAADGRNSLVARQAGQLRPHRSASPRVGLQTHLPRACCPPEFLADDSDGGGGLVQMRWLPGGGYVGLAPTGDGELNASFAVAPDRLEASKRWAEAEFGLPGDWAGWRTIAPVDRAAARSVATADGGVFLVGDAARVVEPFTGEGIYFALRSGELAAGAIVRAARGECTAAAAAGDYARAHRAAYRDRGRLWVNRLARFAALHPALAETAIALARFRPGALRFLTAKVVPPRGGAAVTSLEGIAPSMP